jgi:hypothetical protein
MRVRWHLLCSLSIDARRMCRLREKPLPKTMHGVKTRVEPD